VAGVNQIQVQPAIGLSFASGLRSVLRHDPDVILIGEIRDQETATNAVQSALTGHLVFSTLHTNNAASAVTRLVDMGIEPFLVAATLQGVLAQRLVRRLCIHCRTPVAMEELELPKDFTMKHGAVVYAAKGCRACHEIGYQGQLAIFEYLEFDGKIRQLCASGASPSELQEHAVTKGMVTMREAGWEQVLLGQTTIDEVLRVASDEF
jgi:type II secretory ATPase GspE/PulE/Tfp pilus assembly ATPase PilB-like protein